MGEHVLCSLIISYVIGVRVPIKNVSFHTYDYVLLSDWNLYKCILDTPKLEDIDYHNNMVFI